MSQFVALRFPVHNMKIYDTVRPCQPV